jgi:uncharacterized protein
MSWAKRLWGRREFLQNGALAGLGLGLLPRFERISATGPAPAPARYHELGRTGIKMSDISFGSDAIHPGDENVVLHAFDSGINYYDSAEIYGDGDAETTLGNALKGKRDKVYLTSKVIAGPEMRKEQMMQALEGSLRRMQTDYVDIYFQHAVNNLERLKNPEWYEFSDNAKKQGKIRFTGMSGHAGNLIQCLDYGIDTGKFDVILGAYNFGHDPAFYQRFLRNWDMVAIQPDLLRIIKKAKAHGMGYVAMKTLHGARLNDMRPYETGGATFAQSAFRWVLSNPDVDGLIVSMTNIPQIDEYLAASGSRAAQIGDLYLLRKYAELNNSSTCRRGCNLCESSCPAGVTISEVLRTRMYAVDYGNMRLARDEYAMLEANASACLTCDAKPCAGACPHGVHTEQFVPDTHRLLSRA